MRLSSLLLSIVAPVLAACAPPSPAPHVVCRTPGWEPSLSSDSSLALCAAPGYRPAGDAARWTRSAVGDSNYAWVSVTLLDSAEAARTWGTPPQPRTFRYNDPPGTLHGISAESVSVRRGHVAGVDVEFEIARITGGQLGFHGQPAMRAAGPIGDGRWLLAQGFAERPAELETLIGMLQTAELRR